MSEFNPSVCEIQKAELISYDETITRDITSNFISRFEITQSMDAVAYSGWLLVLDTIDILDGMPIRGEETLNLWIKGMDLGTEVRISAMIHKVTDITPTPSSNGATYKLHFVSKTTFKSTTKKVTEAHVNPVSVMAYNMFKSYYSDLQNGDFRREDDDTKYLPFNSVRYALIEEPTRQFILQPSVESTNIIIPRLNPSEAMFFVAARAFNPATPSQTFRFFETLENYYFCTDEYFLRDNKDSIIDMFFAPIASYNPTDAAGQLNRIETLHVLSKGIDTSTDLFSGSYRSEVVEIDLVRRRLDISKFNYDDAQYIDMTGAIKTVDNNPHTEKFRTDTFTENNARRFMIFRDYTRDGDLPTTILRKNQKLSEIIHNRVSYYHHLNNTSVMAGLKGRLDIRPGMIVNLDIKPLDGVRSSIGINQTLSGRYLVQSTVHSTDNEGTLNTMLKMAKFDWSAQAGTAIPDNDSAAGTRGAQ